MGVSLLEQEAGKQGITVTNAEISDRLATIEKRYFGGSGKRYRTHLKRRLPARPVLTQ